MNDPIRSNNARARRIAESRAKLAKDDAAITGCFGCFIVGMILLSVATSILIVVALVMLVTGNLHV